MAQFLGKWAWIACLLVSALGPSSADAASASLPPSNMGFQGYLTDGDGTPRGLPNPVNLKIKFRIYNALTGGDTLWTEEQTVTVDKGHFSVILGITGGTDLSQFFKGKDLEQGRYLGIQVENEEEISPRIQFFAAPFAQHARYASELVGETGDAIATAKDGRLVLGAGKDTFQLQVSGTLNSDNAVFKVASVTTLTVEGQSTLKGTSVFEQGLKIPRDQSIHFGYDDNSPSLGFNLLNRNTLDIRGAENGSGRVIYFDAAGGSTFNGTVEATSFTGSGASLTGVASLTAVNVFTGPQLFNDRLSLGTNFTGFINENDKKQGWGKALLFSGAPVVSGASEGDNTDPIGMARYNVKFDQSQLRTVIGNDANSTNDAWVLGIMANNTTFPASTEGWAPRLAIDAMGTIELRPDLAKAANAGKIAYQVISSDSLDIVGAGAAITERKVKIHAEGGTVFTGPLEIASGERKETFSYTAYLGESGAGGTGGSYKNAPLVFRANGWVLANSYYVQSDLRLKQTPQASDSARDFQDLRRIEIVDYTYKDQIRNGHRAQKKVIAQQVEKVYPLAVSRSTGVVPDIYKKGSFGRGWLSVQADLAKGDRVRVISPKNEAIHTVTEVDTAGSSADAGKRYRVEPALEDGEVFVYGREVDDFRSVDYEAIAMLNVSATQELAKRQERQESEIRELRERLTDSQRTSQSLSRALAERDERLARLEEQLGKLTAALAGLPEIQVAGLPQGRATTPRIAP